MANPNLMAMASGPPRELSERGGPVPFQPPSSRAPAENGDAEVASLGQLAMAFKEATDPRDAAAFLLEFLEQAGVTRTGK